MSTPVARSDDGSVPAPVVLGEPTDARITYLPLGAPQRPLSVTRARPVAVAFEGRLHDTQVLADAVGRPRDASPAELVAAAYALWGTPVLRFLDGAFAFCLHDGASGVWIGARDRTGAMPLFHARAANGTVLSPNAEAVARRIHAPVDRTAVATYLLLAGRNVHGPFHEGVERLAPGHYLCGRGTGRVVAVRYWSPREDPDAPWYGEDAVDRFPALMRRVLEKHTSGRRAGLWLAGGLESAAVAVFAADLTHHRDGAPHAYALAFDGPGCDAQLAARGVARALELPLTVQGQDPKGDASQPFERSLALNDGWPHPLASPFPSLSVDVGRRAAGDGCQVILTGDGGDAWWAPHAGGAADLLRAPSLDDLRALTNAARSAHDLTPVHASRRVLWDYGLRLLLLDAAAAAVERLGHAPLRRLRHHRTRAALPPWLAPDPALREALVETVAAPRRRPGDRHDRIAAALEAPGALLDREEAFEMGRRAGAAIERPFQHPDVVSFLARTPPHVRSLGGHYKGLLRRLLHDRVPHLGHGRRAQPCGGHVSDALMVRGLRRAGPAVRTFPALADHGIADGRAARALVEQVVRSGSDRTAVPSRLWALLCAERWLRSRSRP